MAALDKAFPKGFTSIANLLGIDPRKPVELCHYGREDSALHLTGGWYHVVGRILSGRDVIKQTHESGGVYEFEKLTGGCEFGFTNSLALVRVPFAGKHLIQLEFITRVPWVLSEPEQP